MINNDIPVVYSCHVSENRQLQLYCFHNDYEKAFNDIEYTRSDGSVKHATAVDDHYMVATGVLEFSDDVANIIGRKIMLKTATYGKKYYVDFEEYCDRLSLIDTNIMYVEWED